MWCVQPWTFLARFCFLSGVGTLNYTLTFPVVSLTVSGCHGWLLVTVNNASGCQSNSLYWTSNPSPNPSLFVR